MTRNVTDNILPRRANSIIRINSSSRWISGRNGIVTSILLCLLLSLHNSAIANVVELNKYQSRYNLGASLSYLIDEEHRYSFREISSADFANEFHPSEWDTPNFGFSDAVYWIKFDLVYRETPEDYASTQEPDSLTSSDPVKLLLELQYPFFKEVVLYRPSKNSKNNYESVIAGNLTQFENREIKVANYLFELELEQNQATTFYMKLNSTMSIQLPLILWSPKAYIERISVEKMIWGAFYGILFFSVVYNLFVFASVRKRSYIYYIFYIISITFLQSTRNGFGYQFFWSNNSWWSEVSPTFFIATTSLFVLLFTREFLGTKDKLYYADTGLKIMIGGAVMVLASVILLPVLLSRIIAVVFAIALAIGILTISIHCVIKKVRAASWYLIAWLSLLVGIIAICAREMGIIEPHWTIDYATEIGTVLEAVLLSLGLADIINTDRKEKFEALNKQHQTMIELQGAQSVLVYQSTHDQFTGLPNNALFENSLSQTLLKADHNSDSIAVLIIHLYKFNEIVNTLGKNNSNRVLVDVCERLRKFAVANLNIIEIDGEQGRSPLAQIEINKFALTIKIRNKDQVTHIAKGILAELSTPFLFNHLVFDVEANIGVSLFPIHSSDTDDLIHKAHIATDVALASDRNFAVYASELDPYSEKRLTLMADLREAIVYNGLDLYYHPLVDIKSEQTMGAEALIRWNHPIHGFIPPDEFIPLAEQTGVITPLTEWVLEQAIKQMVELQEAGTAIDISVNISARNLREASFFPNLEKRIQHYNLSPRNLNLEVTETAMMNDPTQALEILEQLHHAGFTLAIDDFGTGYSSMAYLKSLPAQKIKIDRSFVSNMIHDKDDAIIVETIINMSHILGLRVVAEGVEDEDTLLILKNLGCDTAQGFLFTKPIAKEEFENWLTTSAWSAQKPPNIILPSDSPKFM